jgi:hypothetical protein
LIEERLIECQQNLRVIEKGVISDAAAAKLTTKLEGTLDHLQRLSSRAGVSADLQIQYQKQIRRLRSRVVRLNAVRRGDAVFVNFTPTQRTILTEVFNAIYQSTDDLQRAQGLVDKIVSRLTRKRVALKKRTKKPRRRGPKG